MIIINKLVITFIILALIMPVFASADTFWPIQSIDTAKYSRDLARENINDLSFNATINSQVANIAKTGATHIAIATPYDNEFAPYLRRWVDAARENGLKVWFRGNWSGWEGWFDYQRIDRQQHIGKTYDFIVLNKNLFEDGDIFTACPECENGGPGDPRSNGDLAGHRQFLINEHKAMADAFKRINKSVIFNYNSMNGDVAFLVMNEKTTQALGGVIAVDHYVKNQSKLISDIKKLSSQGGGAKIVLGELGAPIPDIHGNMSAIDQAKWIQDALAELAKLDEVIAINYWTSVGGSAEIWSSNNIARPAVKVISDFYQPNSIAGYVVDELGRPVKDVAISNEYGITVTGEDGSFEISYVSYLKTSLRVDKDKFESMVISISNYSGEPERIVLVRANEGLGFKFLKLFKHLGNIFSNIF